MVCGSTCRTLTAAVALILGAGAVAPAAGDDRKDCRELIPEQRQSACSRAIARSATSAKDRAEALAGRATSWMVKSEPQKAAADLAEAIKLDPDSTWTPIYRGLQAYIRDDRKTAFTEIDEAIRRDPNNWRAYNVRGVLNRRSGSFDKAIADFNEAARLAPGNPLIPFDRGLALTEKGDQDLAIADFEAHLKLRPNSAGGLNGIGLALMRKGERDRAKLYFDQAIASDPDFVRPYRNRGNIHLNRGRYDDAIADYDIAISLDPTYALTRNDRGFAFSKQGDRERALIDYDAALLINPSLIITLNNRASHFWALGDLQRAAADLLKVTRLTATNNVDKQRQAVARERIERLTKELGGQPASIRPEPHKRVALVIGNSRYAHVGALANPANDAREMAVKLRRLGFTDIVELIDAKQIQMQQSLKEFGDMAAAAEWAVVFFAGHGIEVNGVSYLIPIDAALQRDTHVEDEALSLNRVIGKVDAAKRLGLVILDSCRNNPFSARMVRSVGATRSVAQGLALVEPEGNVLVAYAARAGTVAEDGAGKHSPFTEALLSNIDEPGLEVTFLFRKVREEVRGKTNRRQEPWVYGALSSDPIYFRTASGR